jgi:exonuclease III
VANIGTNRRGTDILTREHLPLYLTVSLPSGRGIAARFQGVRLVNIYAPSGAEKRQEREDLFNLELPYLLVDTPTTVIMGAITIAFSPKQTLQATSTSVEPRKR